ncbi:MAG: iron ABC transporter permease [Spirochaetales bacterium]|nr:iron ABC transporter permease [Spirochaetales bacterium]
MTRGIPSKGSGMFLILMMTLGLLIPLAASVGAVRLSPAGIGRFLLSFGGEGLKESHQNILINIRLPRVIYAGLAGAGLALSGVVFQGVFRNPMAEPYLLGVSSGASVGAALFFLLNLPALFLPSLGAAGAAFLGGMGTMLLIMTVAGRSSGEMGALLLAGIAFGNMAQGAVSFLMMLHRDRAEDIIFWMMGSFSSASWLRILLLLGVLVPATAFLLMKSKELNLLALGREEAHSLGINPERESFLLLGAACLITSTIVSFSGIIGFVGLLVPHMVRLAAGSENRTVMILSLPAGAILLILSDLLCRSLMAPTEIPIGVITALLGGPFFLFLLRNYIKTRRSL